MEPVLDPQLSSLRLLQGLQDFKQLLFRLGLQALVVPEEGFVKGIYRLVCLWIIEQELWSRIQFSGYAGDDLPGGVDSIAVLQFPQVTLAHVCIGSKSVHAQLLFLAQLSDLFA